MDYNLGAIRMRLSRWRPRPGRESPREPQSSPGEPDPAAEAVGFQEGVDFERGEGYIGAQVADAMRPPGRGGGRGTRCHKRLHILKPLHAAPGVGAIVVLGR
jgi:hypothetical protein